MELVVNKFYLMSFGYIGSTTI